jgi:hypothetical protein
MDVDGVVSLAVANRRGTIPSAPHRPAARSAARPIPPLSNREECYNLPLAERMKRRLFNFSAAVSLMLLLGTVSLYARSEWCSYSLNHRGRTRDIKIHSLTNGVVVCIVKDSLPPNYHAKVGWQPLLRSDPVPGPLGRYPWGLLGVTYSESLSNNPWASPPFMQTWDFYQFPYWFPLMMTSILPALYIWRWVAGRRTGDATDSCTRCGYDLRESPDRCPECGTPNPAPLKPQPTLQSPAG